MNLPIKFPLVSDESIYLVLTKGSYNFDEILKEIKNTKEFILISTYNLTPGDILDKDKDELLDLFQNSEAKDKFLISHIPGWMKGYKGKFEPLKENAHKNIDTYKNLFSETSDILHYIMINNHSKIILTENIGYVGSANYSIKSQNNLEMGVIFTDKTKIKELYDILILIFRKEGTLAQKSKSHIGKSPSIWLNTLRQFKIKLEQYNKSLNDFQIKQTKVEDFINASNSLAQELIDSINSLHFYILDYGNYFPNIEGDSDRKSDFKGSLLRGLAVNVSEGLKTMLEIDDFTILYYENDCKIAIDNLTVNIPCLLNTIEKEMEILKKHIFENNNLDRTGIEGNKNKIN
ncbi:hypothetical protein EXW38_28955 (plasmid) [Bacillus mycoides]|uniref:phospholipase D-like domain-containing protein n=1 Tax=Bacillus mycoides TaxID=1405 RepID=UPI001C029211|nr:phospholipase D-like domain-containing protein [Bacillus mycoides]QWH15275.1 hypothetical protein EXW38_28955 [Bacillus mycoides]